MPAAPKILFDSVDLARVNQFITERQEEHLHLEFKEATAGMTRDDRKNLAKAVSGFANADGGIVVWGVKTQPSAGGGDCATDAAPISPLSTFRSKLNEACAEAANPVVDGVIHKAIESGADSGFAVTLIPASDSGPHMAKLGEDRYYKRSGSSFLKMEHYEVADMFGRRQRPVLELRYRLDGVAVQSDLEVATRIILSLRNSGRGSAIAPFVEVTISPPNVYRIEVAQAVRAGRSGWLIKPMRVAHSTHRFVGYGDFLVHPGVEYDIAELINVIPISENLRLNWQIASENYKLESSSSTIELLDLLSVQHLY